MNEYHHRQIVETDRLRQVSDPSTQVEGQSPEAELLEDEWNRLIQEAVDRLPPQCRAALALRVLSVGLWARALIRNATVGAVATS